MIFYIYITLEFFLIKFYFGKEFFVEISNVRKFFNPYTNSKTFILPFNRKVLIKFSLQKLSFVLFNIVFKYSND